MQLVGLKPIHYVDCCLSHCIFQDCKTVAFPKSRRVFSINYCINYSQFRRPLIAIINSRGTTTEP